MTSAAVWPGGTAIHRRAEHQRAGAEHAADRHDALQVVERLFAQRRRAEDGKVDSAEQQRLHRHDRQPARLPPPPTREQLVDRRVERFRPDLRRRDLDAGETGFAHPTRDALVVRRAPGDVGERQPHGRTQPSPAAKSRMPSRTSWAVDRHRPDRTKAAACIVCMT
jgi:hypothetical protein